MSRRDFRQDHAAFHLVPRLHAPSHVRRHDHVHLRAKTDEADFFAGFYRLIFLLVAQELRRAISPEICVTITGDLIAEEDGSSSIRFCSFLNFRRLRIAGGPENFPGGVGDSSPLCVNRDGRQLHVRVKHGQEKYGCRLMSPVHDFVSCITFPYAGDRDETVALRQ